MKLPSQRGVALVITLIMLSVITVIAVAFLAISRRERASVTQKANSVDAELAAYSALERAKAQMLAGIVSTANMSAGDLAVSRNFLTNGFVPGLNPNNLQPIKENVSYVYLDGSPIKASDLPEMVANLLIDPRPPIFVKTGTPPTNDFRFYLDLNRNGRFDANGLFRPVDVNGKLLGANTNWFVGDPEWIGILARPNLPHSATNRFIARYAYLIQPAGKTLDLNYIHNVTAPGFYRNQGFGTYEINLGGFLRDLNNRIYPPAEYYRVTNTFGNNSYGVWMGLAFTDAAQMLSFRNQSGLTVGQFFNPYGPLFTNDMIDGCAHLPYLTKNVDDQFGWAWPGAGCTRHYRSVHDFSNLIVNNSTNAFWNRLMGASSLTDSYDRYTYYRMLAQLGTDSAPEPPTAEPAKLIQQFTVTNVDNLPLQPIGKINLNYDNIPGSTGNPTAMDFIPLALKPEKFFTNVAEILLRSQYTNFGVMNIPVYPINFYSQSVHRLLQVAANIYDAGSTDPFPSVFRPLFFTNKVGNVFVSGYTNDPSYLTAVKTLAFGVPHGIPFVVGAKKGLPNFNEYVQRTVVQAVRKLELRRLTTTSRPARTNEMYLLWITNYFGLEAWNSYTNPFPFPLRIDIRNETQMTLTNRDGLQYTSISKFIVASNIPNSWPGFQPFNATPINTTPDYKVPLSTNSTTLPTSVYRRLKPQPHSFELAGQNKFELTPGYSPPEWILTISNRLTYILSERDPPHRILDFVHLPHLDRRIDIGATLAGFSTDTQDRDPYELARCFRTNRSGANPTMLTPTDGILEQMGISLGAIESTQDRNLWGDYNATVNDKASSQASFYNFVYGTNNNPNLVQQAPFSPARRFLIETRLQANDPLVHYMAEDLVDATNRNTAWFIAKPYATVGAANDPNPLNLGLLNLRYRPWGGRPGKDVSLDPEVVNHAVKDPGVLKSDDWDFQAGKFANIGLLGKVHRGTPWQTIYLKADVAPMDLWQARSVDPLEHPTNDWRLMDLFTVAQHPNATRGQLSINQSGQAAWSAVLSGVSVYSNLLTLPQGALTLYPSTTNLIEPDSPQLQTILNGINAQRALRPGQVFHSLGELLSVPELTIGAGGAITQPFLDSSAVGVKFGGISDAEEERIPQQIMSLLKIGDARFVVYCWGQSLKPADHSIVTSGPFFGICTNYQITGETFTRAVVRVGGTASQPKPVIETFNILPKD
jgi:hypothetical protein